MDIYSEITYLKGVGPKLSEKLNKTGIFTILDLLLYFPRDYEYTKDSIDDFDIDSIDGTQKYNLKCTVLEIKRNFRTRTNKTLSNIVLKYGNIKIHAKWFNQPYIINKFIVGGTYSLIGKLKKEGNNIQIINPIIACDEASSSDIIPKYSLKNELTNKIISKYINVILNEVKIKENLPGKVISKYKLLNLEEAIKNIHFPKNTELLKEAIRRLKFQELFTYSLKLSILKNVLKKNNTGIAFKICDDLVRFKEKIPFKLTDAQNKVIREILIDQKKPNSMNRLVQGDVGSGKTIVSIIAMLNVYKNGYQVAMMAPTEILARQHYEQCLELFKDFSVDTYLLVGSTKKREKDDIKEKIREGQNVIIIGTHALIQEDVEFKKLGLIVYDEQHRFGVEQRSKLMNKNSNCDVLVMTATPIPRTMALYLYSDLDISIIDTLPSGRKKIKTYFYKEDKKSEVYRFAKEEIVKGRQVYIVCPLIEEGETTDLNSVQKVYDELCDGIFKDIKISILHGKMKSAQKEEIINSFREGDTKVIISTTVIEVGVNVPNASVMIVQNSERFGLSQLHQLRGRVGRGEYQSYCILIGNAKNSITKKRMEIMTESTDGFYIAEKDLSLRGVGDMFGMRQHGEDGLILADVYEDINILKYANLEAKNTMDSKYSEDIEFVNQIVKNLKRSSKYICFN